MLVRTLYFIHIFIRDLFIASGVGLLLFLAAEDVQPGFVSFWFDIKIVLIVVVISGFLALFTSGFANSPLLDSKRGADRQNPENVLK